MKSACTSTSAKVWFTQTSLAPNFYRTGYLRRDVASKQIAFFSMSHTWPRISRMLTTQTCAGWHAECHMGKFLIHFWHHIALSCVSKKWGGGKITWEIVLVLLKLFSWADTLQHIPSLTTLAQSPRDLPNPPEKFHLSCRNSSGFLCTFSGIFPWAELWHLMQISLKKKILDTNANSDSTGSPLPSAGSLTFMLKGQMRLIHIWRLQKHCEKQQKQFRGRVQS